MKVYDVAQRGRGRGRGRGGRTGDRTRPSPGGAELRGAWDGRGRGVADRRFASRFTDPRFSDRLANAARARRVAAPDTADARFAHILREVAVTGEAHEGEDEEANDEEEEAEALGDVASPDELAALDEDAAGWSGSEVDICEARRRVAIVNCDWDHVRAVDLYAILFHALPLGGQLEDVSVYMSDFGKKMLQYEREHGPDLWVRPTDEEYSAVQEASARDRQAAAEEEAAGGVADDGADDGYWEHDDIGMIDEEGDDGERFSTGKYRKYERDRMKYFYAVATFDSTDTAAHVYGELDGMDVEASGVVLDLRYVDDDEMFEGPVTRADRVPPNFKPLAAFKVSALTQSRFKISWDQDDAHRHYSLRDSFVGDTAESDLAAYMAHSDSDDDGDEEKHSQEKLKIRKRYAALLAEIGVSPEDADDAPNEDVSDSNDSDSDFNPVANADDASDGSMEATFDMDAGTKADQLQHGTRQRKRLADADLGERQQIRYKERRSAAKKAKKELLQNDREAEKAAAARKSSAEKEQLRQSLQAVALPDIEAPSGRAKKKLHAQQKKKLHAQEREHKKKSRLAASLGISQLNAEKKLDVPVAATTTGIDERFKQKLLTDPRFHLDVAQRDKKTKASVQNLAAQVNHQRQARPATPATSKSEHSNSDGVVNEAVGFFLNRPAKKSRKE